MVNFSIAQNQDLHCTSKNWEVQDPKMYKYFNEFTKEFDGLGMVPDILRELSNMIKINLSKVISVQEDFLSFLYV